MTNYFDQAAKARSQYQDQLKQIEQDETLSETGKSQAMARAYQVAESKMRDLRASHEKALNEERSRLQQAAFRVSDQDMASFRDASDRAEQLANVDAALARLERAALVGDSIMTRAIGQRAFQQQWSPVLQRYAEVDPDGSKKLTDFAAFEHEASSSSARFQTSMAFSLQRPRGVSQADLNQAQGAEAAEAAS